MVDGIDNKHANITCKHCKGRNILKGLNLEIALITVLMNLLVKHKTD